MSSEPLAAIEDSPRLHYVFCDESRQTCERFMVLGGLAVTSEDLPEVQALISCYRMGWQMRAELKWNKVSAGKCAEYRALVDTLFDLISRDLVHFHALLIDTHQVNHKKFNGGDKETGFYKFFYQLLLHRFGGRYCRRTHDDRMIVYLDQRNSSYPLSELKDVLNAGMSKRYGILNRPFRDVQPIDSKSNDLLQFADVALGAIGFQKNGYDSKPGAKTCKVELAAYIAAKAGLPHLRANTPFSQSRFCLWNFKLQK